MRIPRKGFTLIELLVVIAIIAILAAILFPVLAQARANARKATCMANMRQIAFAARMYADDYDETHARVMSIDPDGAFRTISWTAVHNYQGALEPYIKMGRGTANRQSVWWDPSDPDRDAPYMWGSFESNGLITCMPRRDSEIASASQTIYATLRAPHWDMVTETSLPTKAPAPSDPFWVSEYFDMGLDPYETDNSSSPFYWTAGRVIPPCSVFPSADPCDHWDDAIDAGRYAGGTLFSFVDGHVKYGRFKQTYRSADDNDWDIH